MAAQAGHVRTGRRLAPAWLAIPIGVLVTVLTIAGLVAIALAHQSEGQLIRLLNVLFAAPLGALVASRRPGNPFGWLMLGAGLLLSVGDGAAAYTVLDYRLHEQQAATRSARTRAPAVLPPRTGPDHRQPVALSG